tara:strand:- start:204 stop:359 length:156 start_codon:yes stop_codon:yes gene_type:complete
MKSEKNFRYLGVIFILVIALGIVSFKYKDQSTKQANKCYQMFELFLEATDE